MIVHRLSEVRCHFFGVASLKQEVCEPGHATLLGVRWRLARRAEGRNPHAFIGLEVALVDDMSPDLGRR